MPEWIIAMFLIGALLSAGDMAKIFLEARRSRREAAVYDNHPQKLRWSTTPIRSAFWQRAFTRCRQKV